MIKTIAWFDFRQPVAYDPDKKRLFHRHARRQLMLLAAALGLGDSDYDVRSNEGGIAVSAEAILHTERLYVQLSSQRPEPTPGSCSGCATAGATMTAAAAISPRSIC
jgi:hypothetical protein